VSSDTVSCGFGSELKAHTAYALELAGTGADTAGAFAPVTMHTRMNTAADAGPVLDTNNVFDQIVVDAAALTATLATAAVDSPAKEFPGETA